VVFGATVDLEDLNDGKKMSYQIVGDDEADIAANKISITSTAFQPVSLPSASAAPVRLVICRLLS